MSYFLAPALVQFRDEVNVQFPQRDKSSDGWIGDASHAARASDHNPCWYCSGRLYGVVRAIDIDIDDNNPFRDLRREILNAAIGDPRVWYVISNGIIYSRTYGWVARRYTGSNGHYAHVHVSLRHGVGEFDTSTWLTSPKPKKKPVIQVATAVEQFRIAAGAKKGEPKATWAVRSIQRALNDKYGLSLATDGVVGKKTLEAWAMHERKVGGKNRPRVPDGPSLRELPLKLKWKEAA